MLKRYVENRTEPLSFFDLEHHPFGNDISDPAIREAFTKKCEVLEEKLNVPAMLLALDGSWTEELLAELGTVSVAEYRKAFKEAKGKDLRTMLAGALQFNRIINATANTKEISNRAREALKLIGSESAINARRVAKFGIKVEAQSDCDN